MTDKKELVELIRARATNSDQKRWQKHVKAIDYPSYSKWVRDTLNRVVDEYNKAHPEG